MLRKSVLILSTCVLALAACSNKSPKTQASPLEQAATQAQTPEAQKNYLTRTPGPGKLTPEALFSDPSLSGTSLRSAKISPTGDIVTVLQGREDDAQQQDLWAYDLESGEGRLLVSSTDILGQPEELSLEEKNRRERRREYGSGIVSYSWVGDNTLLFPLGGDIYLYDLTTKESRQVTATKGFETDPKVFGKGQYVAYVRENNLFVKDLKSGLERQLSDGATNLIRNGIASFVVQEELDRYTGYWPSGDAKLIAYTQTDDANVKMRNRIEYTAAGVTNVEQRYPFAGTPNATVKLGIVGIKGGATKWVDIGDNPDIYLTRAFWSADSKTLFAGILSRDQKSHKLLKISPQSGASEVLFEETHPSWMNVEVSYKALKDGSILWSSERNDKWQLFRVSTEGEAGEDAEDETETDGKVAGTFTPVTPPDILMTRLNCVNQNTGDVYFTGWKETPLDRHLFKGHLDGRAVTQITQTGGQHSSSFNKSCERYIGRFNNSQTPPQTRAFKNDGTPMAWLNENKLDASHPFGPYLAADIQPEFGVLKAADGTDLHYQIFKPVDLKAGEKRPSVTVVYGGPHGQRIYNRWRLGLSQILAHHGFVVFQIDNRGTGNRGKKFETPLYRNMGRPEVKDQKIGADWLKAQSFIDPEKMGVYGWSYGGYMSLMMLGQTDDYAAGVVGAPVTEWQLYDTAYTERYLGDPNEDSPNYTKGSYENSNVWPYLDGITEPFLLIHGMSDDNVVFRNSTKLMDEMHKKGRQNMQVMTYPSEKHGFRQKHNKIHRTRMILEFFLTELE